MIKSAVLKLQAILKPLCLYLYPTSGSDGKIHLTQKGFSFIHVVISASDEKTPVCHEIFGRRKYNQTPIPPSAHPNQLALKQNPKNTYLYLTHVVTNNYLCARTCDSGQ